MLRRLRTSERLRAHVAGLVRHHLRLGFLVHEPQPLAPRTAFAYLRTCSPWRWMSRCCRSPIGWPLKEIVRRRPCGHTWAVARGLLGDALRWRAEGPPRPLLRGDELAGELGIATGPRVGKLLEQLAAAQYAGELTSRESALEFARRLP